MSTGAADRDPRPPARPGAHLREVVRTLMPGLRSTLEDLVRIPSVSADPTRTQEVSRCADVVAELFRAEGFVDTAVVRVDGGAPAVIACGPAKPGVPTVVLYAHHDVQPENDLAEWHSQPFEPEERGSAQGPRLHGRGAADDKAGIVAHLGAIRAYDGSPPVNVVVLVEGEEEVGSPSLPTLLDTYRERLRGDVVVIADSANPAIGQPALTTSLRGLVSVEIELRTLVHGVHSGLWGGLVPDALMAMGRLISSFYDDAGNVAVVGLTTGSPARDAYTEDRLRNESGALDQVRLIGTGPLAHRLWRRPALTVTGLDSPRVDDRATTLVAAARATLSLRVAPGDTGDNALRCLRRHCETHVPWGAELRFTATDIGEPTEIDATGAAFDVAREALAEAWDGTAPVDIGLGGSIPAVSAFRDAVPGCAVVVAGVEDPDTHAHGPDESLHLDEFERFVLAEALLLGRLSTTT